MMKSRKLFHLFWSVSTLSACLAHAAPTPFRNAFEEMRIREDALRVKIAENIWQLRIRGFDLRVFEGKSHSLVSAPDRLSDWEFECTPAGKVFGKREGKGGWVELQQPVRVNSIVGVFQVHNHPYRDDVLIYSNRGNGNGCLVVNHVDIEKYLIALVNSEFNSKWSPEAIAAQVIAARTYAYYKMKEVRKHNPKQVFDVDSTEKDQVYNGFSKEDFSASRIVAKTKGQILTVKGRQDEPLKAFYHSTCGGQTYLPEQIWNEGVAGFKKTVMCPYCFTSPRYNWANELSPSEISDAFLKIKSPLKLWPSDWRDYVKMGELREFKVFTSSSKQILTTWLWKDQFVHLTMNANRFRNLVGTDKLRSNTFEHPTLRWQAGQPRWLFAGRGNGHGVGMCQWGAKMMGERGFKTAAILSHYYPDAVIRKMW
jgi:stage II sporulation protein D